MDCHFRGMRFSARTIFVYVTAQLTMLRALIQNSLHVVPQVSCALAEGSADGLDGTDEQFQIITIACRPWGIAGMSAARREGKPQMRTAYHTVSLKNQGDEDFSRRMEAAIEAGSRFIGIGHRARLGWV